MEQGREGHSEQFSDNPLAGYENVEPSDLRLPVFQEALKQRIQMRTQWYIDEAGLRPEYAGVIAEALENWCQELMVEVLAARGAEVFEGAAVELMKVGVSLKSSRSDFKSNEFEKPKELLKSEFLAFDRAVGEAVMGANFQPTQRLSERPKWWGFWRRG